MAINPENVKLYESERLTDESDGGGRATGREVVDGEINNLFPDISRLDRTVGDVALRKAFVGVNTNNADVYLGAHAIIVEPPADSNVHVVMFDAGSEDDERDAAQQRIESYVVRGPSAQWDLLGTQYEGQRGLVGFQREEQPVPEVGEVYLLELPDGETQQFVRITEVDAQVQTFTALIGSNLVNFERRRLDLGISAPLDYTFVGGEARPEGPTSPHSGVYTTEVADAARYWGTSRSVEEASIGDFGIKVADIYSSLVPSAQAESPLTDQQMGLQPRDIRAAAASNYTQSVVQMEYLDDANVRGYLVRPAVRGTVQLTMEGSTYDDDGSGTLTRTSGSFPFAELSLDHDTGLIEGVRDSGSGSGTKSGSAIFMPGGLFSGKPLSTSEEVTLVNRAFNYIRTFPDAKPRPGTTVVSYMALGKWYDLRDPGNGVLEGLGAGTVNFTTGTINVTLDALPDVGSAVIFSFIIDLADDTTEESGSIASAGGEIELTADPGLMPGTVVVTYESGAVTKTLDDTADTGILAGDGDGYVDYASGYIRFKPTTLPDDATSITVDYDFAVPDEEVIASPSFTNGVISGTIPNAPLEPGSVELGGLVTSETTSGQQYTKLQTVVDNGSGGWLFGKNGGSLRGTGTTGTINYTTGDYSVELLRPYTLGSRQYQVGGGYSSSSVNKRQEMSGAVTISYQQAGPSDAAGQTVVPQETVTLDLLPGASVRNLVPGSLLFTWAGNLYLDRDGIIYTGFESTTGAATAVGTVNYTDRTISLESWPAGAPLGVDVVAALTLNDRLAVDRISFRTPGKPLRPQSLSITVTDQEGNLISELAGVDGTITGASVDGFVNVETGVVDLVFTDGVDPVYVYHDSGRYSAVLFSFLPLDAELIGLNPVRLPADGRVPVYREGDVVVLSHTAETNAGTPTDGQVVSLSRDHQASILVFDADGVAMDPAQYTANLEAGTVTFADPVVLQAADTSALTTPLNIKDRIEHMSVINDVQISGELSFLAPLVHDFPADETVVSSALVWGDINSRVFDYFTQRSWDSGEPNWTSERIGDDTTAKYDLVNWPIEFANRGAITEKWAIHFRSTSTFDVIGETLGIIATGSIYVDLAPENVNTGFPYFVIRAAGWGTGWSNGNVVRFNTEGCLAPIWIARTVTTGQAEEDNDQFVLQVRGDAD